MCRAVVPAEHGAQRACCAGHQLVSEPRRCKALLWPRFPQGAAEPRHKVPRPVGYEGVALRTTWLASSSLHCDVTRLVPAGLHLQMVHNIAHWSRVFMESEGGDEPSNTLVRSPWCAWLWSRLDDRNCADTFS